ncbi:hypothetical protein OG875_21110 [Streptomyces sp. NBC_01498]|uniref:DUF6630 family protein n=1 Tax=Streptomyces sp. NBC_01498 TaxID=2975870 RepID=UPI002E7B5167|nr:DUF6630 family protein [Streptomyces sp. NBC_01498]WTL26844.1 hypothetical protein OG875_21110 [Streptomyces sp. NBC_01498]
MSGAGPAPASGGVLDSLTAVATLLAPGLPAVVAQVRQAHEDPEGYVRAYADRLEDRGVDEPFPGLAWIALVDALDEHRLLAEFDWKEDAEEIRHRLKRLASAPSVDPWPLFDAGERELWTHDFLEACGRHYREVGAALVVLDIESDCYPVACLSAGRVGELVAFAKGTGFAVWPLGLRGPSGE